jgi:hypothetical protein
MLKNLALGCAAVVLAAGSPPGEAPYKQGSGWKPLLNGSDLTGWRGQDGKPHDWVTTREVRWEKHASPKTLSATPEPGGIILNSIQGKTANLVSDSKFGDLELYLEFLIPQGSNSGVYLQGLYEIQVFDSWGKDQVTTSDGGAIYHRWIDGKPVGGSAPKMNATLPPGEWQSYHVWFRAPRFGPDGKKIENAKFLRVLYNGKLVQENFAVEGGTRAHINVPEAARNPLMLQGDHGPVAYRNIYVRPLR